MILNHACNHKWRLRSALYVQKSVVYMEFKIKCTGSSGDEQSGMHEALMQCTLSALSVNFGSDLTETALLRLQFRSKSTISSVE